VDPETVSRRVRGRQDGVIARWSGDELLLLDTVSDRIHQLNSTAGFIWDKLENGDSDEDIVQMLCNEFDVSADQARTDVAATLREFREQGLIQ
jgi:hypothetical protein